MEKSEILEQLQCAKANFENLTALNPQVATHPVYKIAKMQLDGVVDDLEKDVYGENTPS